MAGERRVEAARVALRRRIFEEMAQGSSRWRLKGILPFNILVVAFLVIRGESSERAAIQTVAVAAIACLFIVRAISDSRRLKIVSIVFGIASYFVLVATTGGLISPLLVTGGILIAVTAITLQDPPWLQRLLFGLFVAGFVGLALLSHGAVGQLPQPLRVGSGVGPGVGPGGVSAEYTILAMLAAIFTMVGVFRVGRGMTRASERAAFELAERREELCSENVDRTRALDGMAARLAHEVKNPLAAIKGLSTHMARNAADPKTAERLAIVAAEADRLQSIVEGFLSFSRGLDDLKLASTKPYQVARELAVLLETRAQDAGVEIAVMGETDLVLDADARKLRQALLNVVLNAIEASPRGSKVTVSVAGDCACGGARVTVRDDGSGMTADVLDRIRKPYFTTKADGTGLGLAVARGLVEQHGGTLEMTSVSGKGTTVTLQLPMKAKPACARLPNPARPFRAAEDSEADASGPVPVSAR